MTTALHQYEPNRSDPSALSASTPKAKRAVAASHLAHDARNWLTVLQVYCDLLRSSGAVAGDGRTLIEELSNAVERGQGLVTSLLDSAQTSPTLQSSSVERVDAAGPKTLDLAAVLQARGPLFRQMAGSTISVVSKTATRAETSALREPEFDRILLNLVRNAIDAMPQGGRLTIELESIGKSERRPLVLRVADTGYGIPADILPQIFDSGFSTKASARHSKFGRGYGLAIVQKLTLTAGGLVQVRSRVGHGTCFTIELPMELAPATSRRAGAQRRKNTPASTRVTQTAGRTQQPNNFGANRKGTRVPC